MATADSPSAEGSPNSLGSFLRARRLSNRTSATSLSLRALGMIPALLVPAMLVIVGMWLDLLATGGDVLVPSADRQQVETWAGPPDRVLPEGAWYYDRGLMPLVVRCSDGMVGRLVRAIFVRWPALGKNHLALVNIIAAGFILAAVMATISFTVDRALVQAAERAGVRFRMALFEQTLRLAGADVLGGRHWNPQELLDEKIDLIQQALVAWWRSVPKDFVFAGVLILTALIADASVCAAALPLMAGTTLLVAWVARREGRLKALLADRADHEMTMLAEGIRLTRLAGGLSLNEIPGEPFADRLERHRRAALARDVSDLARLPILRLSIAAVVTVIVGVVGVRVLADPPRLSLFGAAVLCGALVTLYLPVARLWRTQQTARRADQAARALFAFLDQQPTVGQLPGATAVRSTPGEVRLEGVRLVDRAGRKLLDDVTLTVPAGGRVAMLTSDRRAAVALAGLLPRFYDPAAGKVLLDGNELKRFTLGSLRRQVALVGAADVLFTGSVMDNIRCGNARATHDDVVRAAKAARAYDFIQQLPQGFDTIIGSHGMRLAEHEAFRIAIARTLLRNPAVVLLEEPDVQLNDEIDALLDQALATLANGRTLIIVPTRLSTVRTADRIFVFHHARLIDEGTHLELLERGELYRHLHYLQFNEFRHELA